jgi:thiamine-phosphate pyrophosphorylase
MLNITNSGKVFRIIDANLNRATEGLRVVEEISRFVLDDAWLTLTLKKMRGDVSKVVRSEMIKARDSAGDVGRETFTTGEKKRVGFTSILTANLKRAQEALRCLEEFSKLIKPEYGRKFKALRFKLYQLEKEITPKVIKAEKLDFDVYVVTDPKQDHLKTIRRALAAGVKMVQLRDKYASPRDYEKLARRAVKMSHASGAVFIVNDYWPIVNRIDADGVHLGQEDLRTVSLSKVRKAIGPDKIIGISTHDFRQAKAAAKMGADYISVGPVFKTPSKPGIKPVGLKLLRRVLKAVKIPVVAIGGINKNNIGSVRKAGCQRAAVIRAALTLFSH